MHGRHEIAPRRHRQKLLPLPPPPPPPSSSSSHDLDRALSPPSSGLPFTGTVAQTEFHQSSGLPFTGTVSQTAFPAPDLGGGATAIVAVLTLRARLCVVIESAFIPVSSKVRGDQHRNLMEQKLWDRCMKVSSAPHIRVL